MVNKIESFINADDKIIVISDTDYSFITKLDTASNTISTLVNEINNVRTAEEFSNKISHSIDILHISISTSDSTSDILTQAQYLEFFREVAKLNTSLNQKELQSCFQGSIITLGHLKTHIAKEIKNNFMINNTESKIKSIFDDSNEIGILKIEKSK